MAHGERRLPNFLNFIDTQAVVRERRRSGPSHRPCNQALSGECPKHVRKLNRRWGFREQPQVVLSVVVSYPSVHPCVAFIHPSISVHRWYRARQLHVSSAFLVTVLRMYRAKRADESSVPQCQKSFGTTFPRTFVVGQCLVFRLRPHNRGDQNTGNQKKRALRQQPIHQGQKRGGPKLCCGPLVTSDRRKRPMRLARALVQEGQTSGGHQGSLH